MFAVVDSLAGHFTTSAAPPFAFGRNELAAVRKSKRISRGRRTLPFDSIPPGREEIEVFNLGEVSDTASCRWPRLT